MKIAILGSGIVGQTLGKKLVELGHDVILGTHDPDNLNEANGWTDSLSDWLNSVGAKATVTHFPTAAAQSEIIINATDGMASLAVLHTIGAENLQGKILIDVSNELEFSQEVSSESLTANTTSLGEKIQSAFPNTKVVKTFNIMNCAIMTNLQQRAEGNHTVFVSSNDEDAKAKVIELLKGFGWTDIFDLGYLTNGWSSMC